MIDKALNSRPASSLREICERIAVRVCLLFSLVARLAEHFVRSGSPSYVRGPSSVILASLTTQQILLVAPILQ